MPTTPVPSFDDLVQSFKEFLAARTPLTAFGEGTAAGMLVNMVAGEMSNLYALLGQAEAARDIDLAAGTDLDSLARPYGLLRLPETRGGTDSAAPQLSITNTGSTPLTVNSPLLVWSPADPANRFVTSATVTIAAYGTAFLYAKAQVPGETRAVATGQVTASNGPLALTISNVLPIGGGNDQETDDEFRYRIVQTLRASIVGGSSSLAGVQNYLLTLPGIVDVILLPGARGPATLDALVVTSVGLPDDDFLTSVQEQMAAVCAAGISVRAIPPVVLGIGATVVLSSSPGTLTAGVRTALTAVIQGYIDSRTPGLPDSPASYYVTSVDNSSLFYSLLYAQCVDTARAVLGDAVTGLTLLLTVDGQDVPSGDLSPSVGEVFRSDSVAVRFA